MPRPLILLPQLPTLEPVLVQLLPPVPMVTLRAALELLPPLQTPVPLVQGAQGTASPLHLHPGSGVDPGPSPVWRARRCP